MNEHNNTGTLGGGSSEKPLPDPTVQTTEQNEDSIPKKGIKIYYCDDETGPAEVLWGRIARITDTPVFPDFCRDSIVRLDRDPNSADGCPRIGDVLYSPYPSRTWVSFEDEDDYTVLGAVLSLLGARPAVLWLPEDGKPGMAIVDHGEDLDPVLLAKAIGIPQPADEDEDDEEELPATEEATPA